MLLQGNEKDLRYRIRCTLIDGFIIISIANKEKICNRGGVSGGAKCVGG